MIIIILNIVLATLYINEHFSDSKVMNAKLRTCKLYLLEDEDMCDKLEKIYKLSNMQLEMALAKLKDKNKKSYTLLKYIQDNKNKLGINACKLELSHLKEIVNNNFKNITKPFEHNIDTLSGYCLANQIDSEGNTVQIKNEDTNELETYEAIKIALNVEELLKTPKICSYNKHKFDNGLKFIKLYCYLDKSKDIFKIIVNKFDFVIYQNGDFIIQDDSYNMKDFFKYNYNSRQVLYEPKEIETSMYNFTFNMCNKVEDYVITNSVLFSFSELNILPKIIVYNINITPYSLNDNTYESSVVNKKIDDILAEINILNEKIKKYDDDILENTNKISEKECSKSSDAKKCSDEIQSLLQTNKTLNTEKQNLIETKNKLNTQYSIFQNQRKLTFDDNANISSIMNKKINDITGQITSVNEQIKQYDTFIQENLKTYKNIQDKCERINEKQEETQKCYSDMNALLDENNTLQEEKIYLNEIQEKLKKENASLIENQKKFRNVKYTLKEINDMVKTGVSIDYNKYSQYISNDDCIYIQFI